MSSGANPQERTPLSSETPRISRRPSLIQQVSTFLGLDEDENEEEKKKWDKKTLRRMVSRRNIDTDEAKKIVKNHTVDSVDSSIFISPETPGSATSRTMVQISPSQVRHTSLDPSQSMDSTTSIRRSSILDRKSLRKESISSAVFDSLTTLIKKGSLIDKNKLRLQASFASKRSFDMDSILFDTPEEEEEQKEVVEEKESPSGIVFDIPSSSMSDSFEMTTLHHRRKLKPIKIPEIPEETSFEMEIAEKSSSEEGDVDPQALTRMTAKVRRKKSSVRRPRAPTPDRPTDLASGSQPLPIPLKSGESVKKAAAAPETPHDFILEALYQESDKHPALSRQKSVVDDLFYDLDAPEVDAYHPDIAASPPRSAQLRKVAPYDFTEGLDLDIRLGGKEKITYMDGITYIDTGDSEISRAQPTALGGITPGAKMVQQSGGFRPDRPSTLQISGDRQKHEARKRAALSIMAKQVGELKSKKRKRGIGFMGQFFNRDYKKLPKEIAAFIDDEQEEKPWFTYYVTTIQVLVFIISILTYGIGPWAVGQVEFSGSVQDITLTLRRVSYQEPGNPWLGPSYSSLIHLGAKYSPCMRAERQMFDAIAEDRKNENGTGCCVLNDGGCYQSSKSLCPEGYARWNRLDMMLAKQKPPPPLKKSKSDGDLLRKVDWRVTEVVKSTTGAVCGQDPDYCDFPSSTGAQKWPDDMTKWPICEKKHNGSGQPDWMTCQVTGRPCCIQLQGLCRIATKEYCDFVHGYYHEEATLCSQVNCFDDVCGMIPRLGSNPDQFIRLILPIFLHAGILHLFFTIVFQIKIMADMEKLLGWKRMSLLYMISGIGGFLASAIFMPFHPEVGPSGSQCGVFAAVLFETYTHRHLLQDMCSVYFTNSLICFLLFFSGLFPWIDNWSHMFGFIFGGLITIVTFPYIDFPDYETAEKKNWKIQPSSSPLASISPTNQPSSSHLMENQPNSGFWEFWEFFKRLKKSKKRLISKMAALISAIVLFFVLLLCFIKNVEINWPWLIYLNCIPMFDGCQNQGLKLKKWLPI